MTRAPGLANKWKLVIAIQFEILSAVEAAFLVEMIVDRGMDGSELL